MEAATAGDKQILLVAKRDADRPDPGPDDVFRVGTLATVLQFLPLPDGKVKVLIEGEQRATIERIDVDGDYITGPT